MDFTSIMIQVVFYVSGFVVSAIFLNQILLTVFFSIPYTRALKMNGFQVNKEIYYKFLWTILINSVILVGSLWIIYSFYSQGWTAYLMGLILAFVISSRVIGDTEDNVNDYLKAYGNQISDKKDIPSSDIRMKYCKKCGGKVDAVTMKCEDCGKQYFQPRNIGVFLVGILLLIIIIQNLELKEQNAQYAEAEQYIVGLCEGRVNPKTGKSISNISEYVDALLAQKELAEEEESLQNDTEKEYVIVSTTGEAHIPDCEKAKACNDKYKTTVFATVDQLLEEGYKLHDCIRGND